MNEYFHTEAAMEEIIRRRLLRGAVTALRRFQCAARGEGAFNSDLDLRAATLLVRLAMRQVDIRPVDEDLEAMEVWDTDPVINTPIRCEGKEGQVVFTR